GRHRGRRCTTPGSEAPRPPGDRGAQPPCPGDFRPNRGLSRRLDGLRVAQGPDRPAGEHLGPAPLVGVAQLRRRLAHGRARPRPRQQHLRLARHRRPCRGDRRPGRVRPGQVPAPLRDGHLPGLRAHDAGAGPGHPALRPARASAHDRQLRRVHPPPRRGRPPPGGVRLPGVLPNHPARARGSRRGRRQHPPRRLPAGGDAGLDPRRRDRRDPPIPRRLERVLPRPDPDPLARAADPPARHPGLLLRLGPDRLGTDLRRPQRRLDPDDRGLRADAAPLRPGPDGRGGQGI
ncbi:MAG: ABC transporter, permease protein 2 (cluster 1, maltose/g3p/polyamine/iron), partial [uncultured Thermomicrobiales bacterium]